MSDNPGTTNETAGGEGTQQAATFFKEGQGTAEVPDQSQQNGHDHSMDKAGQEDRPDWLYDRYETAEDQAKAYKELYGRYTKKNDQFREDVKQEFTDEFLSNHFKEMGVPDDPSAYEYPDGFNAPDEDLDGALRTWAKENNVSADAFNNLVENVWGLTQADHEKEAAKLGSTPEEVSERVEPVNQFIANNFDEAFTPTIAKIMQTADGVMFMEGIMDAFMENGFAPSAGDPPTAPKVWTREEIREMQSDQRYQTGDPAYVKKVQEAWAAFAEQQQGVRR